MWIISSSQQIKFIVIDEVRNILFAIEPSCPHARRAQTRPKVLRKNNYSETALIAYKHQTSYKDGHRSFSKIKFVGQRLL